MMKEGILDYRHSSFWRKKLWNNSTWDFELIFHTMDINWLSPRQNFFHSSLVSRWRCDQFSQKCPKSKSDNTFTLKKPFVTPNFCKRNLSRMHHFRTVNYFTFKIALVWDNFKLNLDHKPEQFREWNNSQF